MNKNVGFIGCGNMASSMIKGIVNSNLISSNCIIASNPSSGKLDNIKRETNILVTNDNLKTANFSDILFLSVKPNKYEKVIDEIKDSIKDNAIIVSIAAGISINKIEEYFKKRIKIVRAMPNTPALVGEGMSVLTPNDLVSHDELAEIVDLFTCFGKVEVMDESYMDTVTALTGSSPAFVYMFIEALADGAVLMGLPRDKAYKMAAQAVYGSAKMVLETGKHPGELKDQVCSPGGTTIEAVYSLEQCGFRGSVIEAIERCTNKAKNM